MTDNRACEKSDAISKSSVFGIYFQLYAPNRFVDTNWTTHS
jgi:hypothetical protein